MLHRLSRSGLMFCGHADVHVILRSCIYSCREGIQNSYSFFLYLSLSKQTSSPSVCLFCSGNFWGWVFIFWAGFHLQLGSEYESAAWFHARTDPLEQPPRMWLSVLTVSLALMNFHISPSGWLWCGTFRSTRRVCTHYLVCGTSKWDRMIESRSWPRNKEKHEGLRGTSECYNPVNCRDQSILSSS